MYDVIVIGMGVAGISSAIYLKRAGLNVLLLESSVPGGLINEIPKIENYPGVKEISGLDFVQNLMDSVKDLAIEYKLERVCDVEFGDIKKVITNKDEYTSKYVIIASGRRPRMLGIKNEKDYLGKGISTCALCDGNFFKNKDVIVVGGGNTALTESLYLSRIVHKVYVIHRKNSFRADNILEENLKKQKNITLVLNRNIQELITKNGVLTGVKLDNGDIIEASGLFLAIGFIPNTEFLNNKIALDNGYIVVNNANETNIKEVYACGDVIKKDFYQIVSAANDGARVASIIANNFYKKCFKK